MGAMDTMLNSMRGDRLNQTRQAPVKNASALVAGVALVLPMR